MASESEAQKAAARPPGASEPRAKSAAGTAGEFDALRRRISELGEQVQHLSARGGADLQRVVHAASEAVSDVTATARDAVAGAHDVKHLLTEAIDESLEKRPYATLAITFALGFVLARLR
jgi:ElaB/YqjD/DUF883 family membrane-anchored ribosome-binding protein